MPNTRISDATTRTPLIGTEQIPLEAVGSTTPFKTTVNAIRADGGANVQDQTLIEWTMSEAYQLTQITYDVTTTDVIASALLQWPDGSSGSAVVDSINTTWHFVDAYHITHTLSGKTVTQPACTRNTAGNPTIIPMLTVA